MTSLGKYRHLEECSTTDGHFMMLAIDHRLNLRASLDQKRGRAVTDEEFIAFKEAIIRHLAPYASAVLTDPQFGIGPGIQAGWLPADKGFLSPLEETDYTIHPMQRGFRMLENWGVEKIKRMGASGIKLLLYYHPQATNAQSQMDVVVQTIEASREYDIPLYLEPIAFAPDGAAHLPATELTDVVIESARIFSELGADVLKCEFPVNVKEIPNEADWEVPLANLNQAIDVPWALLSAGVSYDVFKRQAQASCRAGASGVIVGRAVWAEAVDYQGDALENFLATTGAERMQELSAIVAEHAHSWKERCSPPAVSGQWYRDF